MKQVTQHTFEMFLLTFTGKLYVKGSIDQKQIEWWSNGELLLNATYSRQHLAIIILRSNL